jgi:bacillithiol system protein YtxJ
MLATVAELGKERQIVGGDLEGRAQILRSAQEVEAFLEAHPDAALFKAGNCHLTDRALETLAPILGPRVDIPFGLIRVVEARAASQRLAELTGVRHQSPQVLLLRDGRAVFARDNWDISGQALEEALKAHFHPQGDGAGSSGPASSIPVR